ncbi:MAG TPA: oligosaccharide flippase family protein [Anaerolineales bacterium]|nr:oligosaccharide flippase family protein [Anaerolineales bacterium]HLO28419.1 oligosaccharide flippase family protein [Anaerolineales bacterium]
MSTLNNSLKFVSSLFLDKGLTKKAYLNALTVILDYAASLLVGFFLTPLMVVGLGDYFYGLWQILNRLIGYISPASGRPGYALKWTLANQQASTDYAQKRRYVGSTLVIWLLFLPFLIVLGGIISWFVPNWVHVSGEAIWIVRLVAALLVTNLVVDTLSSVPQVTLQGENLGYKRMGMSVVLILSGGGFTWLALYLRTGIIGVAVSVVMTTVVTGLFFLWVVRSYTPWFGVSRPQPADTYQMLGLSWWFLAWNFVTSLLLASDVVVLGLLNSVESVTNYSLTKYVPETMIGAIVIVVFGITPGLGSIIGTGDYKKASRLRGEIMTVIWLVVTTLGTTILLWNKTFLGLWVGVDRYSGSIPNLLIVIGAMQLAYIRSDGNIIDLTLRLKSKVLLGLLSVAISIVFASVAVGYFKLGIVGLCLGIMAGRLIISLGYPALIGRFLGISLSSQLTGIIRPAIIMTLLFGGAVLLDSYLPSLTYAGLMGWLLFALFAGLTALLIFLISFYSGLRTSQRKDIMRRLRTVITA